MNRLSLVCRKCKHLSPVSISTISPDALTCRIGLYDFNREIRIWKGARLPINCPLRSSKRISHDEWERQLKIAQEYWFEERR